MAKVLNSTVHISREPGLAPETVPAGTEITGENAWVEDVLRGHGTYDRLVASGETEDGAEDLDKLKVDDLRALATEQGIAGVDELKKPELIKALREKGQ